MKTFLNQKASVERLPLFDNLRGLIIFLTLIMTLLTKFEFTPKWIPHANELNELHLADIGVVMFCFILSVMYSYGYIKKSKTLGKAAAKRQLIIRGLALVGIGFTVNMSGLFLDSQTMFGQMITSWEIIVTFGFINVFGVVFLDVVPEIRFFIGFALVIIHQILLNTGENYTRAILSNDQGGVFGLIPYLGLLLMACSVGEFYFRNKRKFYAFSASVIALGITLFVAEAVAESETAQKMLFVSKFQITLSFVMISF
ncbi:MAG: hypothetical protein LBQ27_01225, partial [Clostridiales bacterium]|nr:hypothetical protein [Clostridiales bacterium]